MLVLKLFALVLIALLPAVLLYLLFSELNSAGAQWLGETVQLGGPVAAFFVFLYFLTRKLQQLEKDQYERANPLLATLRELEGKWKIRASSASSGKTAESSTEISVRKGHLILKGGSFTVVSEGAEPTGLGDWECELAVCDGNRLAYIYRLTDLSNEHSVWQGIVDARRINGDTIAFVGSWHVIGHEHHDGKIKLEKL